MTNRSIAAAVAMAVGFAFALALAACGTSGDDRPAGTTRLTEPADAITKELMVALAQAKNFHHKARVYMSDGKPDLAIAAVRSILAVPFPANAPEAQDVVADARALLAKLLVAKGELDAAMSEIDAGLASATRDSFFVANLYTVKGEVLEAQALRLGEGANPDEVTRARELRRQAIVAFDKSITINAAIQERLMEQRE